MSDWLHGVRVPPLRIVELREMAGTIRSSSGLGPNDSFPVLHFLEWSMGTILENFDWEIVDQLPDNDEARAYPDGAPHYPHGPLIQLTPPVYEQAWRNNGRARFTVLHECGHVLLHRKVAAHHRGPRGADLQPFENSEWQAHQFAAELLMPVESFIRPGDFDSYLSRMGVSREAGCNRAVQLSRTMGKPTPNAWPVKAFASAHKRRGGTVMTT